MVLAAVLAFALIRLAGHFAFQELEAKEPTQTVIFQPPIVLPSEEELAAAAPELDSPRFADITFHQLRKEDFFTILLAGVDDGNGGSDTIILASLDVRNKAIAAVSIPRDTKAVVKGRFHKINNAYNQGGIDLLAATVSNQLGIPIDYTMEIDLTGFAALVDAIDGVDFDVPLDMDYDDELQDLYIHVSAGMQHLDGETALKVVRFRHNNDGSGYGSQDVGRMGTQQKFLKAVAKKMLSPASIPKLTRFVKIFRQYVDTDLTLPNLMWLGQKAIDIGPEGVEFFTLPSSWRNPYMYADPKETLRLINAHFNPYEEDRWMEDLNLPG